MVQELSPVVVIGAGIGGLSAAIHLAAAGCRVIVLEQFEQVGGKMGEFRQDGFRWDTGPSLITMRRAFDDLFAAAGRRLEDYLDLQSVEPITRCFFSDGATLDLSQDLPRMLEQLLAFGPAEGEGYLDYLAYVARLYRITSPIFIYDQPPRLRSLCKVSISDAVRFDGLRTMSQAIDGFVSSPHLRQVLGMFATYVGASPYQAPATLNVIAHVELNQGVWYPQGGIYRIAQAFARLAGELGVEVRTGCRVQAIEVGQGRAIGVHLASGETLPASAVVANLDVATVYEQLLPPEPIFLRRLRRLQRQDPSCSAFVMLLGVRGKHPELSHHNEFFSSDYRREFDQIFSQGVPPSEPTLYISITSKTNPVDAPPGCENWFVQINVPALSSVWDWQVHAEDYAARALDLLARRGWDIRQEIVFQKLITPLDLRYWTGAQRGALYGASSNNRWAAFRRPHNRCPDLKGLYFAGGTTHPGGGVPMVTLSGRVASQLLLEDEG
jgi:diapolycopene oxygenase